MHPAPPAVHQTVDAIGRQVEELVRPLRLRRISYDRFRPVLRLMQAVDAAERRELMWMLVAQGIDRCILKHGGRTVRRRYLELSEQYAPEIRRPRDVRRFHPYPMGKVPETIGKVTAPDDVIGTCLQTSFEAHVVGHDEVLVAGRYAYVMQMTGRTSEVDLTTGQVAVIDVAPRMPAGAAFDNQGSIYFCVCRGSEDGRLGGELGGIYRLHRPGDRWMREAITQRVPWRDGQELRPGATEGADGSDGRVYSLGEMDARGLPVADMDTGNSRPICYANDLALSRDGSYLFFTEPSPYTSMGLESRVEAERLTPNGRLWRVDLTDAEHRVALAAEGFCFLDGILVEGAGESALVTELTRFRMLRLRFDSPGGDDSKELWRDLPGMPDGMARDGQERIWLALLHERTSMIDLLHRFVWLKQLVVRFPLKVPPPKPTGFIVFEPDASRPLYCTMHSGRRLLRIASVAPSARGIFLPSFHGETAGLHWICDPIPSRR